MLKINHYLFLFAITFICCAPLRAASTLAGTVISNQAQLSYSINSIAQTPVPSNIASFTVLEIVNLNLVWQDAGQVRVNTPQLNAPLAFTLSNTGNGPQTYNLTRANTITGDQFDPINAASGAIFLENGLLAGFQADGPNADTVYIPGSDSVAVAPGSSRIIYVVSDISSGLAIGNLGHVDFRAHTRTLGVVGSLPGSSHPNITVIGQTSTGLAITGLTGGQGSARGSYIIDGVVVTVKKTIISPTDANSLIPGIEMRYRLLVEVQGIGSVQNLVVNDPIPAQLTYVANSITLDGGPRTDAVNTDNAQFSNNNVSVNLGNVTAPASYVVEFRAILK